MTSIPLSGRGRSALAFAVALVVGGCFPAMQKPKVKPVVVRSYDIGQVRTTTVGDPIVRVQQAYEFPMYVAQYDYRPANTDKLITRGMQFAAVGSSPRDSTLYLWAIGFSSSHYLAARPDGTPLAWVPIVGGSPLKFERLATPLFARNTEIGNLPGAFTAELVYSGVSNNVLRALYREYVGDLARPAFTQELEYDLSAGREVAFRSIRINVRSATNTALEYEVLSDGGLPWLPSPVLPPGLGELLDTTPAVR